MTQYRAPLRDMRFVFDEVLDAYATLQSLPSQREFGDDLGGAISGRSRQIGGKRTGPAQRAG